MTEEQKEFWQVVVMHLVIAGFAAINALPYLNDMPLWLIGASTALGVTGGLLKASHAQVLHRIHRPSLLRGVVEGLAILLVVYAALRQLEALAPDLRERAFAGLLLAVPAWFTAYALYMLVEAYGNSNEQTSQL